MPEEGGCRGGATSPATAASGGQGEAASGTERGLGGSDPLAAAVPAHVDRDGGGVDRGGGAQPESEPQPRAGAGGVLRLPRRDRGRVRDSLGVAELAGEFADRVGV